MPGPSLSTIFNPPLPPHCEPTSAFLVQVSAHFGTCVPTPLAFLSTLLGSLSILSWLFAQMPQIYTNFQLKSTAGLSLFFLIEWLFGDLTNLLGALFTRQAGWQIVVASYYTFVDICLVFQYFWYTYGRPKYYGGSFISGNSSEQDQSDAESINGLSPINTNFDIGTQEQIHQNHGNASKGVYSTSTNPSRFSSGTHEKTDAGSPRQSGRDVGSSWGNLVSPKTVLHAATISSLVTQARASPIGLSPHIYPRLHATFTVQTPASLETAGTILSWCSTLLYLGSRLPQLYKNWKRKSTAGLSPLLFVAAFCGNSFYSSSLLTNPNAWNNFGPFGGHGWADREGSDRKSWIVRATPFFLGAAGALSMDAMMGVQFSIYSEREEEMVKVRDGRGNSRWQRVSGWMRGWVPMLSRARVVDLAESQRLLAESREIERLSRSYGSTRTNESTHR